MKIDQKVKSHFSLWSSDVGTIVERKGNKDGDWVHVVFPENDKHYGYRQSFNSKDLRLC